VSLAIAVLTLTRDRLEFTRHCFQTLRDNAGCDYDHFVLDQGSTDGTQEWLARQPVDTTLLTQNVGISEGMNTLLDQINPMNYDVIVKFDNDCELTCERTLRDVCLLANEGGVLLSPVIRGLLNPPIPAREVSVCNEAILDVPQIGGIFLAAPAWVYDEFRYSPDNPFWGLDDVEICAWFRAKGGTCGYVKRLEAWHYLGTKGQRETDEAYFVRKDREYAA
jgi:GT2 family glycosyltransferase